MAEGLPEGLSRRDHDGENLVPQGGNFSARVRPAERYRELLRGEFRGMADLIRELTPVSREQVLALTNLEQAGFWADAAIAKHG